MSQKYNSVNSILEMLDQKHSRVDIIQALNDLEAMKYNIKQYTYENTKKLLQDHLDK